MEFTNNLRPHAEKYYEITVPKPVVEKEQLQEGESISLRYHGKEWKASLRAVSSNESLEVTVKKDIVDEEELEVGKPVTIEIVDKDSG